MEAARSAETRFLEKIFDTNEPYLYVVVLPPMILFALGFRRFALLYFLGAATVMAVGSLQ